MPSGVYVRTEKTRQHIREARIGTCASPETRKKLTEMRRGIKSPCFKGGWKAEGYFFMRLPDGTEIRRSHYVMQQMLSRPLTDKEVDHHINGIKDDDRPENLRLFANTGEHTEFEIKNGKLTPWNYNSKKTHCPYRHPYDEKNTYRANGSRSCKACAARRAIERRRRTSATN